MKGDYAHGDMHLMTVSNCCASCGRPFAAPEAHGITFEGRVLVYGAARIKFSYREHEVIALLTKRFNEIVHRDAIFRELYGDSTEVDPKVIDIWICKLRKKLRDTPLKIRNSVGEGFALFAPAVGN